MLNGDTSYTKVVVLWQDLKLCSWHFFQLSSFNSQNIQYKMTKYLNKKDKTYILTNECVVQE
jgi:hypothetical protein